MVSQKRCTSVKSVNDLVGREEEAKQGGCVKLTLSKGVMLSLERGIHLRFASCAKLHNVKENFQMFVAE